MNQYNLKCFGIMTNSGNEALVVEGDNFSNDERLFFTQKQNKPVCVFIESNSNSQELRLDFYYPHKRSPLCFHAILAASYVHLSQINQTKIDVITSMHQQKIAVEKVGDNIFLTVKQELINQLPIDSIFIEQLLDTKISYVIGNPVIVSVGSPKLLIEVNNLAILNVLKPNLELINQWGLDNKVNGCFIYYKLDTNKYVGRNFNHLDPNLEDAATGVAAGALTAYLNRGIILYQGEVVDNRCVIHTTFLDGIIRIGGQVIQV